MNAKFNQSKQKGESTVIDAKVGKKPFIEIPEQLYDSLRLKEGESIQITILPVKKTTRQFREERRKAFEQTQGIWADDEKIAEAFAYLDQR